MQGIQRDNGYMKEDLGARVVVVNEVGEMCWWICRKDDIPIGIGGLIL